MRERESTSESRAAPAKAMFGCCLRAVHASLQGTVSTSVLGLGDDGLALTTARSTLTTEASPSLFGLHVSEPHSVGSPQQGRSVSDSKRAASSSVASGGGVGILRDVECEGQLVQGWVVQTVEDSALQKALPNLCARPVN